MNVFSNSDIMPESPQPSIIEEKAYRIEKFVVKEVFWVGWDDGDAALESEILREFDNQAEAFKYYNENQNGIRKLQVVAVQRFPGGHVEYAQLR